MMLRSCHGLSCWPAQVMAALGLCLIVATAVADETRKPAAQSKAAPAAATSTSTSSSSAASAKAQSSTAEGQPATNVLCVTSVQCFSVKLTTSTTDRPSPLDLRAPDIHHVFSEAELQQKLTPLDEPQEYEIQETRVQGERQLTPVSIGIMAIPWAIIHPTQAWRILMPMTDAK